MVGYPSGQRGQTVNLLTYVFDGSNPSPTTTVTVLFASADEDQTSHTENAQRDYRRFRSCEGKRLEAFHVVVRRRIARIGDLVGEYQACTFDGRAFIDLRLGEVPNFNLKEHDLARHRAQEHCRIIRSAAGGRDG